MAEKRFFQFISLIPAPDRNLESTTSNSNSIAWQLALIISFSVPELATWLKSLRICFFKKIKNFSWKEFLAVFIAESFYVIGMCWLCFSVLPELNSFHGVMVSNLMCFVPSVLCESWHNLFYLVLIQFRGGK